MAFRIKIMFLTALWGVSLVGWAIEAPAAVLRSEAEVYEASGDYRNAAKNYTKAEIECSSASDKAVMLQKAIDNYRKTPLIYQEFMAIERMLDLYPEHMDAVALTNREYEIGDAYFRGEREPGVWFLRNWKFLGGKDRTEEVYTAALKRAPFASRSQLARVRLATVMAEQGRTKDSLALLREVIKSEKDRTDLEYAYMLLCEQLFNMAGAGDGDGKYNAECVQLLQAFKAKFPESKYTEQADLWLRKLQDVQAQRLLGVASFYSRSGRPEVAERYLNQLLKEHPNTPKTRDAEKALVKLDRTYRAGGHVAELLPRTPKFSAYTLPEEEHELLVTPENSEGKFLLPVYKARQNENEPQEGK